MTRAAAATASKAAGARGSKCYLKGREPRSLLLVRHLIHYEVIDRALGFGNRWVGDSDALS